MRTRGSGLILVLWVLGLMSILISGFAFEMHTEAQVLSYYRKLMKADHLARGGHEVALMLLNRSQQVKGAVDSTDDKSQPWYTPAKRLKQGLAVRDFVVPLGDGEIHLDIVPEPGVRNVNTLTDEDWERILTVGNVPEDLWRICIDSVDDWRDGDDSPRIDGAETEDYYAHLTPPYKAKGHNNKAANLDTVEELLLVRGFSREILYGGPAPGGDEKTPPMSGIADLLRAGTLDDKTVNVNAASRRVLLTLPGITDPLADRIISVREGLTETGTINEDSYFKSVDDFFGRLPELRELNPDDQRNLRALVSVVSPVFTITSRGIVHGVTKTIVHVMAVQGGTPGGASGGTPGGTPGGAPGGTPGGVSGGRIGSGTAPGGLPTVRAPRRPTGMR